MSSSKLHLAIHPFASVGPRGLVLASLAVLAVLTAVAAIGAPGSFTLTPDKWFAIAAILVLQGYLGFAPRPGTARG